MRNKCTHKVSIIVPAYNAERYIGKCMDTLIRQNYRNIEIILVNDGSSDSTGNICDIYHERYGNLILVEHCCHCGVSLARLSGIRKAAGEYVVFVDADDWIEDDYISSMVSYMEGADIVAAGISRELPEEKRTVVSEYNGIPAGQYATEPDREKLYGRMLYCQRPYHFGVLPYLCNKMFRRNIVEPLLDKIDKHIFDGEDVAIVYQYLLLSNKIILTDDCKYHYVNHADSASLRETGDAYLNASYLYQELYRCFVESKYCAALLIQLDYYMRRIIWKKDPAAYLEVNSFRFPYDRIRQGARIILYGMGKVGAVFYQQITQTRYCSIVAWADKNHGNITYRTGNVRGIAPDEIQTCSFDYVVIAIQNKIVACKIMEKLCASGIDAKKVVIPNL